MKGSRRSPHYLFHRVNRLLFERSHPHSPNLAIGAILLLDGWLKKTDLCLEYGAGHSTTWFARRVGTVISIENRPAWYAAIRTEAARYANVELILLEASRDRVPGCEVSWNYVNKTAEFSPESFDFILNDGWARSYVALQALPLLKRGGLFCWDDWLEAFPGDSRIPQDTAANCPGQDPRMREFWAMVKDWRLVCHDDGVHSSALFFKPA